VAAALSERLSLTINVRFCTFDLPADRFSFFALTDEKSGEQLDRVPVAEGDILIADRGFMHPERLARVYEQGADFAVRAGWKGARWLDAKGKPFDLLPALAAAASAGVLDCPIPVFTGTSLDRPQESVAPGAARS
jgi:hypothetical protein